VTGAPSDILESPLHMSLDAAQGEEGKGQERRRERRDLKTLCCIAYCRSGWLRSSKDTPLMKSMVAASGTI
jgi:hypothetical protein